MTTGWRWNAYYESAGTLGPDRIAGDPRWVRLNAHMFWIQMPESCSSALELIRFLKEAGIQAVFRLHSAALGTGGNAFGRFAGQDNYYHSRESERLE